MYSPIVDKDGKPFKVVKFATDVTEARLCSADYQGQVAAIGRVQAVIEFGLDGMIVNANDHFLQAMGYRLDEVKGKHHSMFVDPAHAASAEYRQFWLDLAAGREQSGRFRRVAKGARKFGFKARTFRSSTMPAGRSKSSSTLRTSRN